LPGLLFQRHGPKNKHPASRNIFPAAPVSCRDMNIRTGQPCDLDLLVHIDNDASLLFEQAGMLLDLERDLEITTAARYRWLRCLSAGTVLIATDDSGESIGFAALGLRDGEPYLDQLSVRLSAMRQGVGTELLEASLAVAKQARGRALWLTTYAHLSWNRPYYERNGFAVVPAEECGEELRRELSFERRLLPSPEHRVPMRKDL
jgi:GNAT superfamily N-acetyltransferase